MIRTTLIGSTLIVAMLAPSAAAQLDLSFDCDDYVTQAAAQAALEREPGDPNGLDPDGDGIACENLAESPSDTASSGTTGGTSAETPPPAEARIGGTLAGFETEYGERTNPDASPILGVEFDVPDAGSALVSEHLGYTTSIALFAPRPSGEEWSANEPHPSNWTTTEAGEVAEPFLPVDAVLESPNPAYSGVIRTVGYSNDLAATVPSDVYGWVENEWVPGQFSIVYMLDSTEQRVSSVFIELRVEEPLVP